MRRIGVATALAAAALAMVSALHAEVFFFTSDAASWPLAKIQDPTRDKATAMPDFYLRVEKAGETETRTLFKDGIESERRLIGPATPPSAFQEDLFRSGRLSERILYGRRHEMLEELIYDTVTEEQVPLHRTTYSYKDARLTLVERFGADAASLGTKRYRYDPRGRLSEIELSGEFGASKEGEVPGSPLPRVVWSELPASGFLRIERFNEAGQVSFVRTMAEGKELGVERFVYDKKGALETATILDVVAGTSIRSAYDGSGRLKSRESKRGTKLLDRREFEWDDAGRLLAERRLFPAPAELHSYFRDEAGVLQREEFWTMGKLDRAILHESEGNRIEEIYADGILVIRAYFEAGFKIREEFLDGDTVIRERRYR